MADWAMIFRMLGFLYSMVIVISFVGYMPQLHKLWIAQGDCADVSISTWGIWKLTSLISLAYGYFELSDVKFCLSAGINAICIAAVISLTAWKRWKFSPQKAS